MSSRKLRIYRDHGNPVFNFNSLTKLARNSIISVGISTGIPSNPTNFDVLPGSSVIGMVALSDGVPLGYYKDPEKSARTFRTMSEVRWSFPGDYATVEADGTIALLGRGSQVINTAGEKVFAEEVEETLKTHPAVDDCLVVGLPDERFGQSVTAIVSLTEATTLSPNELSAQLILHAKASLASYKAPKRVVVVDTVPRAANGKADYATARSQAAGAMF